MLSFGQFILKQSFFDIGQKMSLEKYIQKGSKWVKNFLNKGFSSNDR